MWVCIENLQVGGCDCNADESCNCFKCPKSSISSGVSICIPDGNGNFLKNHIETQNVQIILQQIQGSTLVGQKNKFGELLDCDCNLIGCPRGTQIDDCGDCSTPENKNKACTCSLEDEKSSKCINCGNSSISSGVVICVPSNSTDPKDPYYLLQHIERNRIKEYKEKFPGIVFPGQYSNISGYLSLIDCECNLNATCGCPYGTKLDDCGICSPPDRWNKSCQCESKLPNNTICDDCIKSNISSGYSICVPSNSTDPNDPLYIRQEIEFDRIDEYFNLVPGVSFPSRFVNSSIGLVFLDCNCDVTDQPTQTPTLFPTQIPSIVPSQTIFQKIGRAHV